MSPPDESTKAWVRSWPLTATIAALLIAAAWTFFKGADPLGSAVLFGAGLTLLGGWAGVEFYRAGRFDGTVPAAAGLLQDPDSDSEEQTDE